MFLSLTLPYLTLPTMNLEAMRFAHRLRPPRTLADPLPLAFSKLDTAMQIRNCYRMPYNSLLFYNIFATKGFKSVSVNVSRFKSSFAASSNVLLFLVKISEARCIAVATISATAASILLAVSSL